MQDGGEEASGVGAAAEPEHEDRVARLPLAHQELVRFLDLPEDAGAEREPGDGRDLLAERRPGARLGQRAHARVVVEPLSGGVPHQGLDHADDVRVLATELIVRAVAADHEVLGHDRPSPAPQPAHVRCGATSSRGCSRSQRPALLLSGGAVRSSRAARGPGVWAARRGRPSGTR